MVPSQSPSSVSEGVEMALGGSLAELTAFMEKQQRMQMEREAQAKAEAKAERLERDAQVRAEKAELEARFEAQLEKQRQEIEAKLAPTVAISQEQLAALQSRLEALHAAQLLTDDELYCLEDICADVIELESSLGAQLAAAVAQANPVIAKASKLVALSERMSGDAALARQLRRRFM